ncbi:MAG: hypothetical protein ACP5OA_01195 [Candidatus Woesearchaeota archaeon]
MGVLDFLFDFLGFNRRKIFSDFEIVRIKNDLDIVEKKYFIEWDHYRSYYVRSQGIIGSSDTDKKRENFKKTIKYKIPSIDINTVEVVLNSVNHFSTVSKKFRDMRRCLKYPSPKSIKRFDEDVNYIKNIIYKNHEISEVANNALLNSSNSDAFKELLKTLSKALFLELFFIEYRRLSVSEKEYFTVMCALRNAIVVHMESQSPNKK